MDQLGEDLALPETGERLLTQEHLVWKIEHLHRYAIALWLCRGMAVVDIGAGEGYGANLLANIANTVVGIDVSQEAVCHSQAKYEKRNLRFLRGSADEMPLETGSVDVVVSFETIEHHSKHEEMMREVKRILRPDGLLLMSSPDKLYFSELPRYQNPFHVRELTLEEFRSLIARYFRNVGLVLQKFSVGSLVIPENKPEGFLEYWGDFDGIYSAPRPQRPVYNICLASDKSLPIVPPSFFEGLAAFHNTHIVPLQEELAQLQNTVEELREATNRLNHDLETVNGELLATQRVLEAKDAEIAAKGRELGTVLNSRIYRLGKALTWPLGFLRRAGSV